MLNLYKIFRTILKSLFFRPEKFECKMCNVSVTAKEHLEAHMNGKSHKAQLRKMNDMNDPQRST